LVRGQFKVDYFAPIPDNYRGAEEALSVMQSDFPCDYGPSHRLKLPMPAVLCSAAQPNGSLIESHWVKRNGKQGPSFAQV